MADAKGGCVWQGTVCVRRERLQRTHGACQLRGGGLSRSVEECLFTYIHVAPLEGIHQNSWLQVNLGYVEAGVHKNALVKLRLCPEHALQLNYKKDAAVLKVFYLATGTLAYDPGRLY